MDSYRNFVHHDMNKRMYMVDEQLHIHTVHFDKVHLMRNHI